MKDSRITAIIYAFAAALFYAINVPFAKAFLDNVAPTYMAAFLYLGAGAGVGLMYLFKIKGEEPAVQLTKSDLPYTVAMVLLDIAAPILLMVGIRASAAASASLLGNFEIVATTAVAFLIFRERVTKRLWAAIALVTLASAILSFQGAGSLDFSVGSLLVLAATVCWGIENNCTRSISNKSTYQIVTVKGFGSGVGALAIALMVGEQFPGLSQILLILLVGFVAYGLSIFTYVRAQRFLGAAKTSAYYAVAPFIGVALSILFLNEQVTGTFLVALAIMIAGTALIVRDTLLKE